MGVYAYSPRALEHDPGGLFDFPDLVMALLEKGEKVAPTRRRHAGTTSGRSRSTSAHRGARRGPGSLRPWLTAMADWRVPLADVVIEPGRDRGGRRHLPVGLAQHGAADRAARVRPARVHRAQARTGDRELHRRAPPRLHGGRAGGGRRGDRPVAQLRGHRERGPLHGRDAGLRRHRRPRPPLALGRRAPPRRSPSAPRRSWG